MKINPQDDGEKENLWTRAKSLKPEITRKQFDDALKQFRQQHHILPASMELVDIPGIDEDKIPIVIKVGDVGEMFYKPDPYSRKSKGKDIKYIHKTRMETLVTDATGKALLMFGSTVMKNDGWLHD